jgi:hypothetical protein
MIVFGETFVPSLSNAELCGKTAFGPRAVWPLALGTDEKLKASNPDAA